MSSRREFLKTSALVAIALGGGLLAFGAKFSPSNMPKRKLGGKNGLEVSALGFGVMGMTYNRGALPDKKAMIRLLHQCVDYGITLFDTAEIYGPHTNEALAGEALSSYKDKICVTTKFGHKIINGVYHKGEVDSRPDTIKRVCDESLKRLKRDYIDMFYQHRFDPKVPIEEVAGTVKDLIKAGKVRHFGVCELNAATIEKANKEQKITAVQSEYHLMWRGVEKDIFPTLERLDIGFVPYSPLNRGFLSGKITSERKFDPKNDNRGELPRFTPEALKANYKIIEVLKEFRQSKKASEAQIALAYLLAKKPYIVPIPGTTKLEHLEENLGALSINLSQKELSSLEQAIDKIEIVGDRYPASLQKQVGF
ncbi:aldo/keto reductase [Campylobacter sp. MIT 99-7217]|uniref:aldo/keto reductase n=1 Tax=Campylobacter sp. MIT 99-7217 TaxID=535091 RepID=UPI00115B7C60|nr:aldo/keto reductase [Campylobacter sp. MIT 99-7217]TQR31887.1 aldo/keto reductase [Campylobacter sp. MIT 99-7217]